MSFGIAEAAGMPLWTILIHVVCSILVALPAIEPGNARTYLFLPLFDTSLLHALNHVGTVAITLPWFQSTVAADTYTVAEAMMNPLLLVSIVT